MAAQSCGTLHRTTIGLRDGWPKALSHNGTAKFMPMIFGKAPEQGLKFSCKIAATNESKTTNESKRLDLEKRRSRHHLAANM